jgi:hypothetical protein
MSARSSVRRLAALAAALAAVACSTRHKPEADPARIAALMQAIDKNSPAPGGAPVCTPAQLVDGATLTQVTLLKLAKLPANPGPEREDWINPAELDSPAARELLDPATDDTTRRQAAYELLSAPFFVVYRVDLVDAPMALKIKELKRGLVGLRVLRFSRSGEIECVKVLQIQNTLEVSDDAILHSNLAVIDPKIAELLRADLRGQLLKHVQALGAPE